MIHFFFFYSEQQQKKEKNSHCVSFNSARVELHNQGQEYKQSSSWNNDQRIHFEGLIEGFVNQRSCIVKISFSIMLISCSMGDRFKQYQSKQNRTSTKDLRSFQFLYDLTFLLERFELHSNIDIIIGLDFRPEYRSLYVYEQNEQVISCVCLTTDAIASNKQ